MSTCISHFDFRILLLLPLFNPEHLLLLLLFFYGRLRYGTIATDCNRNIAGATTDRIAATTTTTTTTTTTVTRGLGRGRGYIVMDYFRY